MANKRKVNNGSFNVIGSRLIELGHRITSNHENINPGEEYIIYLDDRNKTIYIREVEIHDTRILEIGAHVRMQGGLTPWAEYGVRAGLFKKPTDCAGTIEELIDILSKHENYEEAGWFRDELIDLKARHPELTLKRICECQK